MTPPLPVATQRRAFLTGFIACACLLAAALFLQHVLLLEPCPLCILQRVAVLALATLFLAGALHGPRLAGQRAYAALIVLAAGAGGAVAGRQVWLQHLPADQVPECGPGLEYLLEAFPLMRALEMVLRGSGECAEVAWTFLGLSIPAWTLLWFIGFAAAGVLLWLHRFPYPARSGAGD